MANNSKMDRANAQFAKLQRAEDAKKAMSEYETSRVVVQAKTDRLKALRMARDAAEISAAPTPLAAATKKPARRKKGKAASLSDWLDGQDGSGRRS